MTIKQINRPVIILRKKMEGENSIEELAGQIAEYTNAVIIHCPDVSVSISGIIHNIKFFRGIRAPLYHLMTPSEAYLLPFLKCGPRIITYHDLGTIYTGRNALYKMFRIFKGIVPSYFFSDFVTFVSEQTKNEYFNGRSWLKKRISSMVIYNACNVRLVENDKSKSNEKPVILHIGTAYRKNLKGMLKAVCGLNVKVYIAGKLKTDQRQLLQKLNIDFENEYDIDYSRIVELYNLCNIVSFPTFYEGFGLPVIEANVMKKPIISSSIDIIKEIGRDAVCYVNPKDIGDIREAVIRLMQDASYRNALIEKGIRNSKRFEAAKIYAQYDKLYKKLMTIHNN